MAVSLWKGSSFRHTQRIWSIAGGRSFWRPFSLPFPLSRGTALRSHRWGCASSGHVWVILGQPTSDRWEDPKICSGNFTQPIIWTMENQWKSRVLICKVTSFQLTKLLVYQVGCVVGQEGGAYWNHQAEWGTQINGSNLGMVWIQAIFDDGFGLSLGLQYYIYIYISLIKV